MSGSPTGQPGCRPARLRCARLAHSGSGPRRYSPLLERVLVPNVGESRSLDTPSIHSRHPRPDVSEVEEMIGG